MKALQNKSSKSIVQDVILVLAISYMLRITGVSAQGTQKEPRTVAHQLASQITYDLAL